MYVLLLITPPRSPKKALKNKGKNQRQSRDSHREWSGVEILGKLLEDYRMNERMDGWNGMEWIGMRWNGW